MQSILVILVALLALGIVAALVSFVQGKRRAARIARGEEVEAEAPEVAPIVGGCCGNHITCEHDSLLAAVSREIEYYDDEELDRFVGRPADRYSDAEVEEFREVMLSLAEDEVPGWVRSLQLRGVEFPETLRPELYMIISEQRDYHAVHGRHEGKVATA